MKKNTVGWTLLELLVTMSLTGLGISLAAASYAEISKHKRVSVAQNALLTGLELSRHLAVTARRSVSICGSMEGESCDDSWRTGMLVYLDNNQNGQRDTGEAVVLSEPLGGDDVWLVWRSFRSDRYLLWNYRGYASSSNGTFTICNTYHDEDLLRQLIINRGGRVRISYPSRQGGVRLAQARQDCGWP